MKMCISSFFFCKYRVKCTLNGYMESYIYNIDKCASECYNFVTEFLKIHK